MRDPVAPSAVRLAVTLLNALADQWQRYVDFHINSVGCAFCRANLDDLKLEGTKPPQPRPPSASNSTSNGRFFPEDVKMNLQGLANPKGATRKTKSLE